MAKKVDPNLQMLLDILSTGDCIDNAVNKTLRKYKITVTQYNILRILRGARPDPLFVGEVKNRMFFRNSDVTRLLDRLVKRGIVDRQICEGNRRKIEVTINQDGLDLLEECTPFVEATLKHFLKDKISTEEAEKMSSILNIVKTNIAV